MALGETTLARILFIILLALSCGVGDIHIVGDSIPFMAGVTLTVGDSTPFMVGGYPYGWGFNNFYGWGYPYYGNQNNYSYSNNSRFNRTVIPASSRNTSRYTGFTQNLRNSNTRVTPRRTISQPISEISRTSTLSNNRTSINRNLNNTPTINRNEGNRNFNSSNSRSYNNSSMSIGGSRGFNGGSSRGVSSGGGRR